jgi:hypothetical protein
MINLSSVINAILTAAFAASFVLGSGDFLFADIYWVARTRGMFHAEFDGSNQRLLLGTPEGAGFMDFAIDPHAGYIYVANTLDRIERMNLDGTGLTTLIDGLTIPTEIAVDPLHGYIFFSQSGVSQGTAGLYRARLDGSEVTRVRSENFLDLAVDIPHNTLYGTLFGGVVSFDLDRDLPSQDWRVVYSCGRPCGENQGGYIIHLGVAVDPLNEKVYWGEGYYIRRANLDGSSPEIFISGSDPEVSNDAFFVQEVAVDPVRGYLYWGNGAEKNLGTASIGRARLDRSEVIGSLGIREITQALATDVLIIPEPSTALLAVPVALLLCLAATRRRGSISRR